MNRREQKISKPERRKENRERMQKNDNNNSWIFKVFFLAFLHLIEKLCSAHSFVSFILSFSQSQFCLLGEIPIFNKWASILRFIIY